MVSQPNNINYLSPLGFQFTLKKLPHLEFFVQSVNIPGVSINPVLAPNPNLPLPLQGDRMNYDELVVSFKVDEELKVWKELYEWMRGITFPRSTDQYARLKYSGRLTGPVDSNVPKIGDIYSDASLIIETSHHNPNITVDFVDCYPINLSTIEMRTTDDSVNYLTASITFRYTDFIIDFKEE